ncbi:FAD/NAD(P)-dependent oxidoreductase [Actinophytocola algeriensis]|uniref:Thioredoxin reductase n=1 Tax=Actinophytocola algeriensis TaxID=1768010 RepID=A0A7W7QCF0_9PSEU|nr:FAD/NAD(P)-binding oxidoreductase [Actinophytocola algeriensis]MBB4910990.1 thioredoxin reductase [Actinophytocola algeriensis]MBE1473983.1 thioredoxin reductase [Actinophytocola algeriensis]
MTTSPADIAVIGAGPAGLAAAAAARGRGARVALLDSAGRPGGQYWRHRDGHNPIPASLRQDILAGHAVWHVEVEADGFVLHTTAGEVRARTVIVATGAYDRQLPFPGWTLPGVFTAGGAQAMLKGHGVPVGDRVVVAGTGPFLLPVAAALRHRVTGVFEAGSPLGFARHPLAVARNPGKLVEGARYLRALHGHRIPFHTRTAVVAAHGDDRVHAVTVARLDRNRRPVSEREIECDAVAVGYGFTPQLELPLQLGCDTRLDADGSLVATADEWQRASVPGVYLAGEVCGVGGAQLSVVEGAIAGAHAAGARPRRSLLRKRAALRAFAAAMHDTYRVGAGRPADDTIVCRCEEVTVREVRESVVDLGATDPRGVKLLARPGMGLCQGRVCGYATACLVAEACGRPVTAADLRGLAARPIAAPVTLGNLAEGVEDA